MPLGQRPIPALVVGTGFGCRVHAPALRAAGFEVAGLVGTNPQRLARKAEAAGIPATFTDLDEAISRTGAAVVTIATPPSTHGKLALTAIARGCHVICEKPFAFDAAEAEALVAAADEAGIIGLVGHQWRWQPERALFGRAIAEGLIGTPRFLVLDQFIPFCADPESPLPAWWFDVESGGGWLGAGGSHIIDQVRAWLGEFRSLSANLFLVSDRKVAADDSYSMRFALECGVEGSMQQTAGAWGPMATLWRCAGTHGTVWTDQGKVFVADKAGTRELPLPAELALPSDPATGKPYAPFDLAPFVPLCMALRDAIEGRSPQSPVALPTFRDGLAAMRVLDAMRSSSAQGGALKQIS
jgi:predicted dehydrogenase